MLAHTGCCCCWRMNRIRRIFVHGVLWKDVSFCLEYGGCSVGVAHGWKMLYYSVYLVEEMDANSFRLDWTGLF